jgi:hypothetical protein
LLAQSCLERGLAENSSASIPRPAIGVVPSAPGGLPIRVLRNYVTAIDIGRRGPTTAATTPAAATAAIAPARTAADVPSAAPATPTSAAPASTAPASTAPTCAAPTCAAPTSTGPTAPCPADRSAVGPANKSGTPAVGTDVAPNLLARADEVINGGDRSKGRRADDHPHFDPERTIGQRRRWRRRLPGNCRE